jgi:acetylornithine deacetylase
LSRQAEDILTKLVAFDTTSRNPNRACIDFIRDYLDGFGVASDVFADDSGGKACLWATVGKSDQPGIALAGHSDVVPVDGQKWDSDPFKLTERDGKLFARGSADMKGFIACALAFVPEFLAAKSATSFHLALTSDEETDMSGAMRLTDALAARDVKPAWFWIGEPTGMDIVDQHKGVAAYTTRFTGVSGHSSLPDKGLNAIEMAAQFMGIVLQVQQRKKDKPFSPSRFDPPYTTFNLGKIQGGTAENIIAERCEVLWQVRAHPGEHATEIVAGISDEAKSLLGPRFAAFAQVGIETCPCFDIPPFFPTPGNPGEKKLKNLLKCEETHAVGFATEAGIFQKLGSPAVICGPGDIRQAHQPNEFIDKIQLAACVDLMRGVLLSSCARED